VSDPERSRPASDARGVASPPVAERTAHPRLPRLDLYLAAGVAIDEGQRDRLAALGVDLAAARAVRAAASRAAFGSGGRASPAGVIELFGRPTVRRVERLAWDLVLWPEHRFECAIQEWGVDAGEIVRRPDPDRSPPARVPSSIEEARELLRPWYHTRRDLERIFGDPVRESSDHPHERYDWKVGDGSEVTCAFGHGLLLDVRRAAPAPPPSPGPWWAFWRR
jgi:hypothetical protein